MSQRRTLQSGYSLMSRGEPKIWLTGGMLVICLAMIISLLSLIIFNGLATFWPGPVHWLVLSNNELDIGEPQRQEVRATTETGSPNKSPSYFYRTANFDVTNRHYRWFQPQELSRDGIVVPDWALVIERLAWGRMYALPARLSLPLHGTGEEAGAQRLGELTDCHALLTELAADLQTASATEPALPFEEINTALVARLAETRSQVLQTVTRQATESAFAPVQIQSEENGPWQAASATTNTPVFAARYVVDQPESILSRLDRLLIQLGQNRRVTEHLMHQISMLDGQLSEARIGVRQAELNTGKTVLDKIDTVGPLVDGLVAQSRTLERLQAIAKNARQLLADEALADKLQQLLARYESETLAPMVAAFKSELDAWQQQFDSEPPAIGQATRQFAKVWQTVVESKGPLERRIKQLELDGAGYELSVMVPTGATPVEFSTEDGQALLSGKWTEAARAVLSTQSIEPTTVAPQVTTLNDQIKLLQFESSIGRIALWCVQRADSQPVWLLPQLRSINCQEIVRLFPANRLGLAGKLGVYVDRWREFLLDNPREGNTEGGVFPAIWGTVVMTLIMTLAVVPFGVIAALYLREYTRSGPIVSLVRISINNLAGVPSIVYGVFGLAFFCYSMGAFIDGGARNAQFGTLPSSTWYLVLMMTTIVGVGAFLSSVLSGGRDRATNPWKRWMARLAPLAWLLSLAGIGLLVFKSPFFDGFYEARLPAPTFGKEGLLWASLTLALLTLPVVIVATEEALSAVPNSLREGSLACGASKWQTIYRIVLPHARPGILTGAILAMARGIGEVAPLMLVGALPVAPDLPLDGEFPYFHGSRSFMHLGYQIYWLGFQSQNSEASRPLVFTCTLLLILIVISLNLSAILLRARLRKRFQGNQF